MTLALSLAAQAGEKGEVPVGAVLVRNGHVLGKGANAPISTADPTAHAEVLALREAGQNLQNYRLIDSTLYVTLEPCSMCAGALIHSRVKQVIFGTADQRTGAAGSVFQTLIDTRHNHTIRVRGGLLAEESRHLLQSFFQSRR